ncbi:hypothetical protein K435DRAFT_810497 [Dendrothele bispora CBS 962.96]|uniref:Uncharacterized protein n=1 Tax=Dendrothele bispora (strain CBS 962.96) TaxID=1314807 RepID=A0A4S8KV82_DENBC|nr:hypothetical protein K435DRAFT_810497 [Dendrothele bispora CBS 962.96]
MGRRLVVGAKFPMMLKKKEVTPDMSTGRTYSEAQVEKKGHQESVGYDVRSYERSQTGVCPYDQVQSMPNWFLMRHGGNDGRLQTYHSGLYHVKETFYKVLRSYSELLRCRGNHDRVYGYHMDNRLESFTRWSYELRDSTIPSPDGVCRVIHSLSVNGMFSRLNIANPITRLRRVDVETAPEVVQGGQEWRKASLKVPNMYEPWLKLEKLLPLHPKWLKGSNVLTLFKTSKKYDFGKGFCLSPVEEISGDSGSEEETITFSASVIEDWVARSGDVTEEV